MPNYKSFPVYGFKAIPGTPGLYEAYYAVFGNVDLVKDRIVYGAFKNTLQRWKDSGDPIPVIFSHQWDDLDSHIGEVLEAEERPAGDSRLPQELKELGGLYTKFQLDLEVEGGKKMDRILGKRRIREGSFAYDIPEGGQRKAEDGANELIELDLIEVGPTLKGANPATRLASAAAHTKAYVAIEGSYEDLQSQLRKTLHEAPPAFTGDIWYVGLEATYPDHLVAAVEPFDGPVKYYQVPYTAKKNAITFGAPTEVAIRGVVTPIPVKSDEAVQTKANSKELSGANEKEPRSSVLRTLLQLEELEAS